MLHELKAYIAPVRLRQIRDLSLNWASWGLCIGTILGCTLLITQLCGVKFSWYLPWLLVALSTLIGATAGLLWPRNWLNSASLIDTTCNLKDRTITAYEFAQKGVDGPIFAQQHKDALQHLAQINPATILPLKWPGSTPLTASLSVIMLVLSLIPTPSEATIPLPPGSLPVVQEVTSQLEEEMLKDIELFNKEEKNPELEELTKELKELIKEMKADTVDQKEALAKLSEMQQLVSQAIANMDVTQVENQLNELAAALEAADAFQPASKSIKEGKYDKAAEELEKADTKDMSKRQRDAVSANLAKLANNNPAKKNQLSDAVNEILEGLESNNESLCKSGQCKASSVCKKQGLKKSIKECLGCQLNRLSECKSACQGQCNSNGGKSNSKSESPKNTWGKGSTGQAMGDEKTSLDSQRKEQQITGVAGDGPSEKETETTLEARQLASRNYQEKYKEFRKQMEEVLDAEPLPLGHRATVRRYFEAIRPTNNEDNLINSQATTPAEKTDNPQK